MRSTAKTPEEYIQSAGAERGAILTSLRKLIKENLSEGFEEALNWGMLTYQVPLSTYPNTYNKQPMMLAALANQKNYLSLYLMIPEATKQVQAAASLAGKKLKTGKSCINFTKLDDLPLATIQEIFQKNHLKSFIAAIEEAHGCPVCNSDALTTKESPTAKKASAKVAAEKAKKTAAKKPSHKKLAAKSAIKTKRGKKK